MTREQLRADQRAAEKAARTVRIPIEFRGRFRTSDRTEYRRMPDGSFRRAFPKVRGKQARAADKRARQTPGTQGETSP